MEDISTLNTTDPANLKLKLKKTNKKSLNLMKLRARRGQQGGRALIVVAARRSGVTLTGQTWV